MRKAARTLLAMVATALVLIPAAHAVAQQGDSDPIRRPFDRDCMDDYARDLCSPEKWLEIVASFQLEPAETIQAQGWFGVRVFTINGYSRDMPMISVLHTEQDVGGYPRNPQLEVRAPRAEGAQAPVLKRQAWRDLAFAAVDIARSATAAPVRQSQGRENEPASVGQDDEVVICMHAWVTVIEVLGDQGVVRRVRNACGEDALYDAAYELSAKALRGFPHCNHLDPANYRNESEQLNRCMALAGDDRIVAAEVMTILDGQVFDDAPSIVTFATPETRVSGEVSGASLSTALGLPQARVLHLYATNVRSVGNDVVVEGSTHRYGHGENNDFEADIRHVWRKKDGAWRLLEFTLGPWRSI